MSCMWCVHFYRPYDDSYSKVRGEDYLDIPGNCTLQPAWTEVTGKHYCGQFKLHVSTHDGLTSIASWYISRGESSDVIKRQSAEIKRLKEANRKLREKMRSADAEVPTQSPTLDESDQLDQ